jgi:hypothetical protein
LYVILLRHSLFTGGLVCRKSKGKKADNQSRLEKVLRRLDEDNDGNVDAREFKQAIKRLRVKDAGKWNSNEMVRMLFSRVNLKKEKSLSIAEFIGFVKDSSGGVKKPSGSAGPSSGAAANKKSGSNLSDDEDDVGIFARSNALSDHMLIKKVTEALFNSIAESTTGAGPAGAQTLDNVKTAIRKFFNRSDPEGKGVVSEERFRAFTR